jgi:hypothetical protein
MMVSGPGREDTYRSSDTTCSLCTGCERKRSQRINGVTEAVIDMYGSIVLVPTIVIRRFNPMTSLKGPTSLVDNVRAFFSPGKDSLGRLMEHAVHLLVGLTDVSLGVAGLALNPGSPQKLYTTLKDPEAPMTFENYSTLFLIYWVLGALLYLCICQRRAPKGAYRCSGGRATSRSGWRRWLRWFCSRLDAGRSTSPGGITGAGCRC